MNYEDSDGVSTHDGFPNPATDSSLQPINLTSLLIKHNAATYLMRLSGNEWQHLGIFAGDIAIVDRALTAGKNDLVVWVQDDQFMISYRSSVLTGNIIWGIVTTVIHRYRKGQS